MPGTAAAAALERVSADVNDRSILADADGRYEVVLSRDERPGNWIRSIPTRRRSSPATTSPRRAAAAANPENAVMLTIEPLDDPGPPSLISDASFATRLEALTAWLRAESIGRRPPTTVPSFVSIVPNELPTPANFRASGVEAWGAVDIYYASARFALQPGEALVLEGSLPSCRVRQRDALERVHADVGVPLSHDVAQPSPDRRATTTAASASSSPTRIPGYPTGWTPKDVTAAPSSGAICFRRKSPHGSAAASCRSTRSPEPAARETPRGSPSTDWGMMEAMPDDVVRFGDCEVDLGRFEIRRGGRPVHVEPQVFDVLVHLSRTATACDQGRDAAEVWGTASSASRH